MSFVMVVVSQIFFHYIYFLLLENRYQESFSSLRKMIFVVAHMLLYK